ncbi:hypothetical protein KC349_g204 [Hortaea werneckii]|nr:hypothetical protein KC349_g204 [Hortaea werneckii]
MPPKRHTAPSIRVPRVAPDRPAALSGSVESKDGKTEDRRSQAGVDGETDDLGCHNGKDGLCEKDRANRLNGTRYNRQRAAKEKYPLFFLVALPPPWVNHPFRDLLRIECHFSFIHNVVWLCFAFIFGKSLRVYKLLVSTTAGEQFGMGSLLANLSSKHDSDDIGISDCRQAMSDHDGAFALGVKCGSGLVEKQNLGKVTRRALPRRSCDVVSHTHTEKHRFLADHRDLPPQASEIVLRDWNPINGDRTFDVQSTFQPECEDCSS